MHTSIASYPQTLAGTFIGLALCTGSREGVPGQPPNRTSTWTKWLFSLHSAWSSYLLFMLGCYKTCVPAGSHTTAYETA